MIGAVLMTADAVGGVWRYAVDLGRALVERGVCTTVAVMGPAPRAAQVRELADAGVHVALRPCRLEWMREPWDDVAQSGEWLLGLERAVTPDVVHLNGYAHAAQNWTAPVLVGAHSCVRTWWRAVKRESIPSSYERYTNAVRAGLTAAGIVVAPTATMLRGLREEYATPFCGTVIPNGTEVAARRACSAATKEPFIFSAARVWDEAKNVAALCAIAPRLPWPVVVAGDPTGPDGDSHPLPNVQLLGPVPAAHMADWFGRASIYVLPARYEPFGLSVLEAACAGCALVLGDIPSLRENWDGAAVFVPPDDPEALAVAVRALVEESDVRAEWARVAHARASLFTIDRTADAYLATYQMLAA